MNKKRKKIYDKSGGKCWYCGVTLKKGWHIDHLEPVIRESKYVYEKTDNGYKGKIIQTGTSLHPERDNEKNMVPSCPPCNLFKTVFTLEQFRNEISKQVERARKTSVNYRTAERFGLIIEIKKPIKFWFESV